MDLKLFEETYEMYHHELDKIKEFLVVNEINSNLDMFYFLNTLIEEDFYKKNNDKEYHNDYLYLLGSEVFNGNPTCRHSSMFIVDILNKFGTFNTVIPVNVLGDSNKKHLLVGMIDLETKESYILDTNFISYAVKNENNKIMFENEKLDFKYEFDNREEFNKEVFKSYYNKEVLDHVLLNYKFLDVVELSKLIIKSKKKYEYLKEDLNKHLVVEHDDLLNLNVLKLIKGQK